MKATKKSVNYSVGDYAEHCGICKYYDAEPHNRGTASIGICTKVQGQIRSDMWCKKFRRAK